MEPEEEVGSGVQNQNLHDLQNYLVTFKNEIENSDDVVLTNIGVDSSDVNDLYSGSANHDLQDPGESEEVSSQFSSGFYSEQGMLGTTLSDEPTQQQIQNMVTACKRGIGSEMTSSKDDEHVNTVDLDSMHAQMAAAGFTESQLNQSLQGLQSGSTQGIIMTSLDDGLVDPTGGKMIQIVSLGGEDGQYLSLGDGQQMQILNSEDLGLTSESLVGNMDTSVDLNSSSTATALNTSTPQMALVSLSGNALTAADIASNSSGGSGIRIMTPDVKREIDGSSGQISTASATAPSGSSIVDVSGGASSVFNTVGGVPQLVALSGTGEGGQPQLFAVHRPSFATDTLQMGGLLGSTEAVNQDLACHTITIMPSELAQTGDMNYVLVLSQPDGQGDKVASMAQLCDLKQDGTELGDGIVDENGMTKNMLRLIPKKFVNDINQPLVCDYCNYTSPKRYLLTRHMKSHSEERPFKCEACHRGFKTPASLLNHVNTHTGTRPHKCKTCEAAFTTSGELVRHIRYRHTFEKPHRCPECDYASVELSKLKRHMRSHTGERPYKCPNCPYASPDTYKLKRHMRIHTGEKPYECDICHARFTQSNSLKAHKLIHSGNKPVYQCSICPTTCGRKTDLKIHFNKLHSVGSPLDCKKCGKAFSDRYSYKQHLRSHDMDKCFKCDQCDFMAATEKQLDVHISSHGKKYECDQCHLTFILKHLLDKHKILFHNSNSTESSSTAEKKTRDESESRFPSLPSVLGSSKFDMADLPSESEESSNLLSCAPSTSDTLHKNLMQDIKEGKLGDVPQVVIVHPDGSSEEISSKLTGDKWSIEELFCTATNNGQTMRPDEGEKETMEDDSDGQLRSKESSDMGPSCSSLSDDPNINDNNNASTSLLQTTIDQINEQTIMSEESHSGMSQLCEASTQAEIESDTDSSGETPDHSNILMNVVAASQLSSMVDGKMMEEASGKQRSSKLLSTTGSTTDQELITINASSSSSSSSLSTEQTTTTPSSSLSSITNNKSNSYLKSLIMQRPIVIKTTPSSSSTSSLLSSSSNKKLTSLLQFPNKTKPIISTNPNLIVKQNSDGQQYSLLKNLNFKSSLLSSPSSSSTSPPSSSSSTISSISQSTNSSLSMSGINNSNPTMDRVKQLISQPATSGIDNRNSVGADSQAVLFKTQIASSSSTQINSSDFNHSSLLSFSLDGNNKQLAKSSATTTPSCSVAVTNSPAIIHKESDNTTLKLLNFDKETVLFDSEKSQSNTESLRSHVQSLKSPKRTCETETKSLFSSSPSSTSQPYQPTITENYNSKQDQPPVDSDSNVMGKLNCTVSDSDISSTGTDTAASESIKIGLAAFLQSREGSSTPQLKISDSENGDLGRKENNPEQESGKLNFMDDNGTIWTLVGDEGGQVLESLGMETALGSPQENSPENVITPDGKGGASSANTEQASVTDSKSEKKTVSAPSPLLPPVAETVTGRRGKSGKRHHAEMDQSLVVRGKRIRKALVKVSL